MSPPEGGSTTVADGYVDTLLDHARQPRNAGHIERADGIGTYGDPNCGDFE